MVISDINKHKLSQQVVKTGWKASINDLISNVELTEINNILIETRFSHTGWISFFDFADFNSAIVVDIGLGGSIISLAKRVKYVYAVYFDDTTKIIFRERIKYFKLDNVILVDAHETNQIPELDSKKLLVSINDGSLKKQEWLIKKLLRRSDVNRQIHLAYDGFFQPSYIKKLPEKYFITGRLRAPFKFISKKEKRATLKYVLYLVYLAMSKVRGKAIITTDAVIDDSLLFKILLLVKQQLKLENIPKINCGYFVKPFGILLKISAGSTTSMLRIAFDKLAGERYGMAAKVMNQLDGASKAVPKITLSGECVGHPFQLESFFDGKNIEANYLQSVKTRKLINDQAYKLLLEIHKRKLTTRMVDSEVYDHYFDESIKKVSGYFSSQASTIFSEINQYIKNHLSDGILPFVINHGDYSVDNLMVEDDSIIGVIDWEFSQLEGLPLVDLLFYIISVRKKRYDISLVKAMSDIYRTEGFDKEERDLIERYCADFKIPLNLVSSLAIMTIINFLIFRLDIKEEVDRKSIYDRNYMELVNSIGLYLQDVV